MTEGVRIGAVAALWRYPVKSLRGEKLSSAEVGPSGLLGDRAYGFLDEEKGRVLSAKSCPRLLEWSAGYAEAPSPARIPPAMIRMEDGTDLPTDSPKLAELATRFLGRRVRLVAASVEKSLSYEVPPTDELPGIGEEGITLPCPPGTFHDALHLHLLATATLAHLGALHPEGRFDSRRFRPNVLIDTGGAAPSFLEESWIGHRLRIGRNLGIEIISPTIRCAMITLPQEDLPRDPVIHRVARDKNNANIGCYALVRRQGEIQVGDAITDLGTESP